MYAYTCMYVHIGDVCAGTDQSGHVFMAVWKPIWLALVPPVPNCPEFYKCHILYLRNSFHGPVYFPAWPVFLWCTISGKTLLEFRLVCGIKASNPYIFANTQEKPMYNQTCLQEMAKAADMNICLLLHHPNCLTVNTWWISELHMHIYLVEWGLVTMIYHMPLVVLNRKRGAFKSISDCCVDYPAWKTRYPWYFIFPVIIDIIALTMGCVCLWH